MASKRAIQRAARRLAMRSAAIDELTETLFASKRRVYRRTLLEHATFLGYEITRPQLSDAVERALRDEAADHARSIARTYNRELAAAAQRMGSALPESELDAQLGRWARSRQRRRAPLIAVTEAYGPHADATLAFFRETGLGDEVLLEFGGHPELGDAPPACIICQAIVATNPHTPAEAAQIGTPHPNCRQHWHLARYDQAVLPATIDVGNAIAGIVGAESLLTRAGGREEARDFVLRLRE